MVHTCTNTLLLTVFKEQNNYTVLVIYWLYIVYLCISEVAKCLSLCAMFRGSTCGSAWLRWKDVCGMKLQSWWKLDNADTDIYYSDTYYLSVVSLPSCPLSLQTAEVTFWQLFYYVKTLLMLKKLQVIISHLQVSWWFLAYVQNLWSCVGVCQMNLTSDFTPTV